MSWMEPTWGVSEKPEALRGTANTTLTLHSKLAGSIKLGFVIVIAGIRS